MSPGSIVSGIASALIVLVGVVAGSPLHAQSIPPARDAAIRLGVQAALDAYRERAAAGQWDALLRLYADDPQFHWVSNGTIVATSFDDIRKHFRGQPAGSRIEQTYHDTEITPLGPDIAEVMTRFETKLVDPAGGGFGFGGILTMILVQRGSPAEGWQILSGHSSSPVHR
jgi:hypothetical protein